MKHKLEITTRQLNKLYALTGRVRFIDTDIHDLRMELNNLLESPGLYESYQADFKVDGERIILSFSK